MNKKLKIFLIVTILILASCTSLNPKAVHNPPEDIIILVGPGIPVEIPQGYFDDKDNYRTREEFERLIREREARQQGL